jgi:hypothetical protein
MLHNYLLQRREKNVSKDIFSDNVNNGSDDNHSFRNSKLVFFVWIVLLVGLLVTISPLIASEPGEILGPELGYIDLHWQSDDKIVAIQSESEYYPDKLHYTHGEIVTVKWYS